MPRRPRRNMKAQSYEVEGQLAFDFFNLDPIAEPAPKAAEGVSEAVGTNAADATSPSPMAKPAEGARDIAHGAADDRQEPAEPKAANGPRAAQEDHEPPSEAVAEPDIDARETEPQIEPDRPSGPVAAAAGDTVEEDLIEEVRVHEAGQATDALGDDIAAIAAREGTGAQAGLSERRRAQANVEALRALAKLRRGEALDEQDGRALAGFSGWGGAADAFSNKPEWTATREEVDELLTDDERRAAAASVLTAFYTPAGITRGLWSALQEMGFAGGRVLEPGAGAGNILRDAPEGLLDACEVHAVEIDPTAAAVCAALVPQADVTCADFSKVRMETGSFDAVIGNVPFSSVRVSGPGHAPMMLHDFYFARALDAVKPGGAVAFVTSRGTLDKALDRARRDLAARAELAAAVRLPDGAFRDQAGTDVGTDVVVLRKLADGEAPCGPRWESTVEIGAGVRQNEYFAAHPDAVIGETAVKVGRFGPELVVDGDVSAEGLEEAIAEQLRSQICAHAARISDAAPAAEPAISVASRSEDDGYEVLGDGQIVLRAAGRESDATPEKPADAGRLRAMIGLRDMLRRQLALERGGAANAECDAAREELRGAYGEFETLHGHLNDKANSRLYSAADAMRPALMALELLDGAGKVCGTADILRKRVVDAPAEADVRTPEDALAWSIGTFGRVEMSEMARKLDIGYDELWQALSGKVFFDAAGEGEWATADEYLSGNVRAKLRAAEAAMDKLDSALLEAATDAWRREKGLPRPKRLEGEARAPLSALLAAGRSLPRNRNISSSDWAELPEMSEVPLSDEAAWLEVLKGASGKHSWRAWERLCFDGKLAAERSRIAHELTGESMNDWDARTWCDENGIDPVASDWQASLVAQGASFLAGRRLGGRINLADAAARAVSCAVSGGTGYHTERDFANDPSLGELAYLVATGAEGYRCPLLTTWLEETTAEAEKEYQEATARKSDSPYHYVRSIGERIELKMGERAWDDAVEEVGHLIEPWRAERAAHIAAFKDSDAPAAVAYRSRAEHLNENVEALQEVAPDDLRPSDISASLGSTWIPADDVKDFMIEEIGLTWVSSEDKIIVSYSPVTAKWSVKAPGVSWKPEGLEKWGTDRVDPIEMIKSSLNCARVTVRDAQVETDPISGEEKVKKVVNPAETLAAQQKQSALEDRFAAWVWEDEKRASRLAKEYNERFNSIVPRAFDGAELRFPDMNSGIALRPWQRDAVARILQGRTGTLLAHTVGAGKTMEFCAGAMESKRLGLCNKPMIVVPNHLVDQTAAEFLTLYPAARLLVARKEDFKKENRRALMARTATGDWDSIIVGQSQFEMLPLSPAAQKTYVQQRIDEFQEACRIAKEQAGKRDPTVKEMERQLAKFQARMEALIKEERKDDAGGITFDATGVDMLVVDEAHAYKNLALQTKMSRVAGVASHGSQRSEDMLMKTRWLRERYGGRNIVFATGTPVSNSMVELYNMQTYLDPETLRSMGINCFDEWATTFGKREVSFEITPEGGGYQQKERFSRFVNMPELMSAARTFSDIKMAADIDLKLPECEVHAVAVQPTEEQKAAVEDLIARAERLREGHVDPTVDNMLKVTGDGRKVALDVRLLDPESATDDIEPGGKIEACAENVRRIWKDTADQRGAQLVFCDTSTPASGKWNIYEDLKRRLVDLGIPPAQIAFVHDAGDKPERKEALFARVREGDVRVLIGSTEKMGTGTNVQDRLAATHDLDCPWRPADLEQRQGRIMRQGNRFEHVDVFRYVCVGTFDSYLYQLVEGKQRFVSQVFSSDAGAREVGDLDDAVTLSYSQMKAAAAGDDRIRERMELENKVTRLTMLKQTHDGQARRASRRAEETLPARIAAAQEALRAAKADAARTLSGWEASGMAISGRSYADKKEAGAALRAAADRVPAGLSQEIGSYRGLFVMARMEAATGLPTLGLSGERTFWVSRSAYVQPIRNVDSLDKIADMVLEAPARLEAEIAEAKAELEAARTATEAPFPQADELTAALARLSVLDEELGIASGDAPEDDDAPSEGGSAIAGGQRLPASEQDNELPAELSASLESVTVKETTEPAAKDSVMPITKMAGQYDPDDPPAVQLACLMDDLTKFTYHRINGRPEPDMPAGGPRETSELIAKLAAELGPDGDKWMARVEELRNVVRKRNAKNAAGDGGGVKPNGQQPHAAAKPRFKRN